MSTSESDAHNEKPVAIMSAPPRRRQVGLALGGGAVRGFAHVGALEVLEGAGVPIDLVAGTSVGSIIAAFYCAGVPVAQIAELARKMSWSRLASPAFSRDGLLSFAPLENWLVRLLGNLHFEDLALPLAVATVDMDTGEEVVINSGPLAPAVRASCSVPGIVTPTRLGGRLLGDGGIVNNLPVNVVRRMGADYVIAIDVFQPTPGRRLGPLARGLEAIEILVQRAGGGLQAADCLITPDLSGQTFVRFGQGLELMSLGACATKARLGNLLADLDLEQR